MQEYQVTVKGQTSVLKAPFWVIVTQNPIELEGTLGLPKAQVDRFLVRLRTGYPKENEEFTILQNRIDRKTKAMHIEQPVISLEEILDMQKSVENVQVVNDILQY